MSHHALWQGAHSVSKACDVAGSEKATKDRRTHGHTVKSIEHGRHRRERAGQHNKGLGPQGCTARARVNEVLGAADQEGRWEPSPASI